MWKPVIGYEGIYEVSDQGEVRSLPRIVKAGVGGKGLREVPGNLLRGSVSFRMKYHSVSLWKNNNGCTCYVHRLVLEAFVGSCPVGMECRHLDGNSANNALENLCWGTPKENQADRVEHGTDNRGERCHMAKLTAAVAWIIRRQAKEGIRQKEIVRWSGISQSHVSQIMRGRIWKGV